MPLESREILRKMRRGRNQKSRKGEPKMLGDEQREIVRERMKTTLKKWRDGEHERGRGWRELLTLEEGYAEEDEIEREKKRVHGRRKWKRKWKREKGGGRDDSRGK